MIEEKTLRECGANNTRLRAPFNACNTSDAERAKDSARNWRRAALGQRSPSWSSSVPVFQSSWKASSSWMHGFKFDTWSVGLKKEGKRKICAAATVLVNLFVSSCEYCESALTNIFLVSHRRVDDPDLHSLTLINYPTVTQLETHSRAPIA